MLAQLASGPKRPADLAPNPSDPRKLLRTPLWLRKFDLVEIRSNPLHRHNPDHAGRR